MFRVRKGIFGRAVLQCGSRGVWEDAAPTEFLQDEFYILSGRSLRELQDRADQAELRAKQYASRVRIMHNAAVDQARKRKKKLPVLTEAVE